MPTLGKNTYLSVADVAKLLGISRSGVRRYTDVGILRCARNPLNQYRLYRPEDVARLLQRISLAEKEAWL